LPQLETGFRTSDVDPDSNEQFAKYYSDLFVLPFGKKKQQIAPAASGSKIMELVLKEIGPRTSQSPSIFLVNLGKKRGGPYDRDSPRWRPSLL
jgi:hypothetical protein